jgi:hypothetical protein
MANLKFTSSTTFKHDVLVPVSAYPGLKVPPGVRAYAPIEITFGEMSHRLTTKFLVAGLTVLESQDVTIVGDWKQISTSPVQWQFQGGSLKFDVELGIYIIDKYASIQKLYELIMTHELLHVKDSYDIVDQYLPAELPKDENVKKFLIDCKPVDASGYQYWFQSGKFKQYVTEIWNEEWNKRGTGRDSGPLYEKYKQDMAKLLPRIP